MSEPVAEKLPRWSVDIVPVENGEAVMNMKIHAEDVLAAEVAFYLSKLVTKLVQIYGQRLPTETEQAARQREHALQKEHPATKLYVREGTQTWIGDAAPEGGLKAAGWMFAGPVPEGVRRTCEWARDPQAFEERFPAPKLAVVEGGET